MSILIRGMKMPKDCLECELYGGIYSFSGCNVASLGIPKRYNYDPHIRPEWCPLVKLPERHGDLIDKDALVTEMINGIRAGNLEDGYEEYQNINNMDDCVKCVKYADVVIEAEERGER